MKTLYPKVFKFINESVFNRGNEIPENWMRGQLNHIEVNKYISDNTGIDYETLSSLFIESVKSMKIETRLLNLAKILVKKGKKVALVTNNMDVFNFISIRHHKLDECFPVIINSFDYGLMKHDENGKLFQITMEMLDESGFSDALLVDDSRKMRESFERIGGTSFAYDTFEKFEPWAKKNLTHDEE